MWTYNSSSYIQFSELIAERVAFLEKKSKELRMTVSPRDSKAFSALSALGCSNLNRDNGVRLDIVRTTKLNQPPHEEKSLTTTFLLCACLGFFGAHHFYLGRKFFGFVYLMSFGIFGIGYIIDILRISTLVDDANAKSKNLKTMDVYVLWFPLGILGFHHFYMDNFGHGMLYLFTFGVGGIGWLIDFFRIPTMVTTHNLRERSVERKSTISAYMFAMTPFGVLGAHHYYLNQWKWGLFYTLTAGAFGVGYVFDLIRLPLLVERANRRNEGHVIDSVHLDEAYLLWLTFGIFGAHRLYLKNYAMALIYLFTFGIFGIGWLFDAYKLHSLVKDYNDFYESYDFEITELDLNSHSFRDELPHVPASNFDDIFEIFSVASPEPSFITPSQQKRECFHVSSDIFTVSPSSSSSKQFKADIRSETRVKSLALKAGPTSLVPLNDELEERVAELVAKTKTDKADDKINAHVIHKTIKAEIGAPVTNNMDDSFCPVNIDREIDMAYLTSKIKMETSVSSVKTGCKNISTPRLKKMDTSELLVNKQQADVGPPGSIPEKIMNPIETEYITSTPEVSEKPEVPKLSMEPPEDFDDLNSLDSFSTCMSEEIAQPVNNKYGKFRNVTFQLPTEVPDHQHSPEVSDHQHSPEVSDQLFVTPKPMPVKSLGAAPVRRNMQRNTQIHGRVILDDFDNMHGLPPLLIDVGKYNMRDDDVLL